MKQTTMRGKSYILKTAVTTQDSLVSITAFSLLIAVSL